MMVEKVDVGSLVVFVTVDRGVDIETPSGTLTTEMSDRLVRSKTYYPHPGEKGVVIAGPVMNNSGHFRLWQVWVGNSGWWFPEDELMPLDVQQ